MSDDQDEFDYDPDDDPADLDAIDGDPRPPIVQRPQCERWNEIRRAW